jgi:hypothetical protein
VVHKCAVSAEHEDQVVFESVQHAQSLDDQLQRARIALPAHDPSELSRPAQLSRNFGEILDVLESFSREFDGSGGHGLELIKRACSAPIKGFV